MVVHFFQKPHLSMAESDDERDFKRRDKFHNERRGHGGHEGGERQRSVLLLMEKRRLEQKNIEIDYFSFEFSA